MPHQSRFRRLLRNGGDDKDYQKAQQLLDGIDIVLEDAERLDGYGDNENNWPYGMDLAVKAFVGNGLDVLLAALVHASGTVAVLDALIERGGITQVEDALKAWREHEAKMQAEREQWLEDVRNLNDSLDDHPF